MSKSLNLYGGLGVGLVALLTGAYNFADRSVTPIPDEAPRMNAEADTDFQLIASAQASNAAADGKFGLGRPALPEEVAAWDLDVAPDGTGLPPGSGDVWTGEEVFVEQCAVCHGDFAEGVGNWPKLAGGDGTLADEDPLKTVGSYWPYLSTVWDYVHRSMPFGQAQTLTHDEVYAITAYILYSNYLVDDDFVLSNENFLEVEMPNADGFIIDDREEAEKHFWNAEPCMENCKDSVEITMRATILDVTPDEGGTEEEAAAEPAAEETQVASADATAEEPAAEEASAEPAAASIDMALAEEGEKVFRKCKACHQVGDGAKNRTGPVLNGVIGADFAHVDGFRYGKTIQEMSDEGMVWNEENLTAFLADPRGFISGTKMSFAGLRKDDDIKAVIEYLKTFQ
ncbi:c-type cytochrome [Lutimaribacter sp. EGI FJ00015]|uniref:C-type cytochrome n=1 Tax=Lutimaribacter degradans TaxID=2945989 RepID=A0ACC5ZVI4_9RHOB|nr:c-type cytochrome [Lutimaribacter sp. EGI FJ00013]MCM2562373.1 c-type cytochrome [Lutimaribacter sp. EGI FJ00013]MCO0613530.1 c-type cytochrome [Lutimaribacter sp. EGI FJ00015]MCO0636502.1 c-type cytochrome [Lutimaribacter sp. EGI FJ00014]